MAYSGQALYKLMILFMLNKVSYPLTNNQIVDFLLDKNYTDYFRAQEAIKDLVDDGQIKKESHVRSTLYELTDEGKSALVSLEGMLDAGIKQEITTHLREHAFDLRSESGVRVDYTQTPNNEYHISCRIIEDNETIFELNMNVISKEDAEKILKDFRKKSQPVYMTVMKMLLE